MNPTLSRLRFPVGQSIGRRYPESPHPYRNDFQRDRDRIVHTRAFRRLEDKTQVFTAGLSDHFRNRLTHTLEVSQISRTVASVLELDEDLTEALALAHDIGHPPFAHAGEQELNRQMGRFGDRFDHNLHALRIVEELEKRYAMFPGLNLTFEVREGIAKHSRDFEAGEFPELDEYMPGLKPSLEAQLIDPADEIAYNTADLDDGFSAGLFTKEDVAAFVPQYAAIQKLVESQFPGAPERVQFQETLRRLIDFLASGLIRGTLAAAQDAGLEEVDGVRHYPERLACLTPSAHAAGAALKQFLNEHVYSSSVLMKERKRATAMVAELFQFFLDDPGKIPEAYRRQAGEQPPHRVVCDYIAGMTDGFFHRTCRQMRPAR